MVKSVGFGGFREGSVLGSKRVVRDGSVQTEVWLSDSVKGRRAALSNSVECLVGLGNSDTEKVKSGSFWKGSF